MKKMHKNLKNLQKSVHKMQIQAKIRKKKLKYLDWMRF